MAEPSVTVGTPTPKPAVKTAAPKKVVAKKKPAVNKPAVVKTARAETAPKKRRKKRASIFAYINGTTDIDIGKLSGPFTTEADMLEDVRSSVDKNDEITLLRAYKTGKLQVSARIK